jgi:hypothetical protein
MILALKGVWTGNTSALDSDRPKPASQLCGQKRKKKRESGNKFPHSKEPCLTAVSVLGTLMDAC